MIKIICKLLGHPLREDGWIFSWEEMKLVSEECPICKDINKQGGES
jgi:hypothetical protein